MSQLTELHWLALTVVLTGAGALPYVIDRMIVRGPINPFLNPKPDEKPLHAWAQRAQRAHANAGENLVLFAPAVLILEALHKGSPSTVTACAVYFWARLVHYVSYTLGIPFVRSLGYIAGLGVVLYLLAVSFGMAG